MVGYPAWNGEVAGSSPVSYTSRSVRLMARTQEFQSCDVGSLPADAVGQGIPYGLQKMINAAG